MTTDPTAEALRARLRDALGATNEALRGFSDAGTHFQGDGGQKASHDEIRFAESVRLARTFAAINDPVDRMLVLALVTALSEARQS